MPMTKQDTAIAAGLGLLLLAGGKALASTSKGPPKKPLADPAVDGAALLKRANQASAAAWAKTFADVPDHPISPLTAAALARWAGLESSGKATNTSRLNERGLMQAGPQTVAEGGMTPEEWGALVAPGTTRARHAALAIKYVDWLARKAMTYVAHPPADPVDLIWYAKMWHQRPVDVRDGGMTGVARDDANRLAIQWAADPVAMHRLRAANVVAWGTP